MSVFVFYSCGCVRVVFLWLCSCCIPVSVFVLYSCVCVRCCIHMVMILCAHSAEGVPGAYGSFSGPGGNKPLSTHVNPTVKQVTYQPVGHYLS